MINSFQIVTDTAILDTYGKDDISLNYQIDDILDITKRSTNWSKTITLPGTPTNNQFFEYMYDVNVETITFNPIKRTPCVIRVGATDVFNGYLQLMNIVINNGLIEYEVSLAGAFKNLLTQISDYGMDELDLSEYDHIRSRENIINSWSYNIYKSGVLFNTGGPNNVDGGQGYVYPFIINGNNETPNETWNIYDAFPAIYVKTVVDKIIKFANYTYTSKFFESSYFKKLILPYSKSIIEVDEETYSNRETLVGIPTSTTYLNLTQEILHGNNYTTQNQSPAYKLQLTRESGTGGPTNNPTVFKDPSNQWNSSNTWTCANTGTYDIEFVGQLFAQYRQWTGIYQPNYDAGSLYYYYKIWLHTPSTGAYVLLDQSYDSLVGQVWIPFSPSTTSNWPSNPWTDLGTQIQCNPSAENVFILNGQQIKLEFGLSHSSSVDWDGLNGNYLARLVLKQSFNDQFTYLSVKPSVNNSFGNDLISMNQILSSYPVKMSDFFLDIIKMFNLIVVDDPNDPNNIIIEPRDDYFSSKNKVLEWDDILDNDSDFTITPMSEIDAKTYTFTYATDDDFYNKEYTTETKRVYGDYQLEIDNDFSTQVVKLELKTLAPTPDAERYLKVSTTGSVDTRVAPFFVELDGENFKPKNTKQRILFYDGLKPSSIQLKLQDYVNGPNTIIYDYPYAGMWDDPKSPQYDLGFGRTDKIYWDSNNVFPNRNLFQQFHKKTLANIVDPNSRLLECSVYLTPKDIATFDFRDKVFLKGSYWRVNKIKNYNPVNTDRLTDVELFKLTDIDTTIQYTGNTPTGNQDPCPVDMISKKLKDGTIITVSQSGQFVSEDCCKSFGGTYQNGVCYLKIFPPVGPTKPIGNVKPLISKGGLDVVPTIQKTGPTVLDRFGTSRNSLNTTTIGSNNYVPNGSKGGIILGSNSSLGRGSTNSVIIGDNITGTEDNTLYLGNFKINQYGNILASGLNIIDGGEDVVFYPMKTNPIEIVDGTKDNVRNPGGSSYARPVIDGNLLNPNTIMPVAPE